MIKRIVLLSFLFLAAIVTYGQETPSQQDWDQYFNAIFLPEGNEESEKALRDIENTHLHQFADRPEKQAPNRERAAATMSKQAASAEDAAAPSAENLSDNVLIAPVMLPQAIESAEKAGESGALKSLYSRYRAEYPIHKNVYLYGHNALNAVSAGGWLVVQGHLDTYPIRSLQKNEKLRTDVTVVNLEWLRNDAAYRQVVAQKLPRTPNWTSSDSETELIEKLQSVIPGKVHLSLTLPADVLKAFSEQANPVGIVLLLGPNVSTAAKHHQILGEVNWNEVTDEDLPTYVKALQQNYLAALLIDAKLGQPEKLGSHNREALLESLYKQRNTRSAAKKYLKSE